MCEDSEGNFQKEILKEVGYTIQQYRIDVEKINSVKSWGCTHRCACFQVFHGKDCYCKPNQHERALKDT